MSGFFSSSRQRIDKSRAVVTSSAWPGEGGRPCTELKRVFRRFYRIHGMSLRAKGSGLGLFIVRSVAKRHGGKAYAESQGTGHGSTFTLLLPKGPDAA